MKLRVENGEVRLRSFYRFLVAAWFFGIGGFFFLMFLLFVPLALFADMPFYLNGEQVEGRGGELFVVILMPLLALVISAFHAVFFSGFMILGLWLYRKFFGPFTITETPSSANGEIRSPSE